jgi:hypothetical protein
MYYTIKSDPFHERGIFDDPKFPDGVSFLKGAWIDWLPQTPLIFKSNCDSENPPREFMGGALPVWSKNLLNAFQAAGCDNFQFFPAIINDDDGKVNWDNYFAINVLGLISAADLFLSKYIKISERPSGLKFLGFQDLVIDPKMVQGLPFFRLAENPLEIIVHGRILDYLSANSPSHGWGILVSELKENE